jgi:hypothetical protein
MKLSELDQDEYEVLGKTNKDSGAFAFMKGLPVGALKSVGETAMGAGEIGRKIQKAILPKSLEKSMLGGESIFDQGGDTNTNIRESLKANAPGQGTGKFIGTVAQYLVPSTGVTKAQGALGTLASQAPRGLQTIGQIGARFIPEAIATGGVSAIRSGGDLNQAKNEGLTAGAFSVAFGGLGALARSTYFPKLNESIAKAFGTQGKKSGGVALNQTAQKAGGLSVLKNMAKELDVTLDDGTKAKFDPNTASYNTTLQAWNGARKKIYDTYSRLSQEAGETSVVDLSDVRGQISSALDAPILSIEKNAVKSLLKDFDEVFKDPANVDPKVLERFLESLNSNTANGLFTGTSDAATSRVYAGTAKLIRERLDEVITEATGSKYQVLRSQYSSLKSLEDDLVRKFQQDARQIGGGLPEYMAGYASGDLLAGILQMNPAQILKGVAVGTFATLKRKLSNPQRFLQRSFKLLEEKEVNDVMKRMFGG